VWSGTFAEVLPRPVGRPSQKSLVEYKGFLYQAASWKAARRVVAKVEHHAGEWFRAGLHRYEPESAESGGMRFYNKRGAAEQWLKEGKQAVKMTRLSCHCFSCNEARLALSLLAYNLGNVWRWLPLPQRIEKWSLTSLQQPLVKTGGRLMKTCTLLWPFFAEGHLTRRRFGAMLGRIALLPVPMG
jgi:Transposase DDE domain group 1